MKSNLFMVACQCDTSRWVSEWEKKKIKSPMSITLVVITQDLYGSAQAQLATCKNQYEPISIVAQFFTYCFNA